MLNDATGFKKVYIAAGYTDLRRGMEGLANIIRFQFHLDPYDKKASGPAAVIHCGPFRVELFDPADPGFIRSVLEALKHAQ